MFNQMPLSLLLVTHQCRSAKQLKAKRTAVNQLRAKCRAACHCVCHHCIDNQSSCDQEGYMTVTHMCFVDPDEDEAYGAELRHGQPGKPGHHSLAAGMPALPALIDENCLHEIKMLMLGSFHTCP